MVFSDPTDAIQAGVYSRLHADSTLANLVTNVVDGVPEEQEYPFVVIGDMLASEDGVLGNFGRSTVCTIHTWTRAQSYAPGNAIASRVSALLYHQEAALDALVTGHKVWEVIHEFSSNQKDPEPGIRHRVDRFRFTTSQD